MKIAASDYDGTLFRRGEVSREDLEAISAWREKGHLFGLATGRDLNLTRTEIEGRNIPCDFTVCNTGAGIYDAEFRPIHQTALPPAAAGEALNHPAVKSSRYCLFSRAGHTYIIRQATESWLTGLGLPLVGITEDEARALSGLTQIGLEYGTTEEARLNSAALTRDFGHIMYAQQSGICVDIIAAGVSKAEGLALYIELNGLAPEDVLTVGDSENDLSMLTRYHGYAMTDSPPEVLRAAAHTTDSPAAMLWDNM